MSEFPSLKELLENAFWAAGDSLAEDESVHGLNVPYFDREMSMVDASGSGMPHEFWKHLADAWRAACEISTVEQVDALPTGAHVRGSNGHGYEKSSNSPDRPWLEAGNGSPEDRIPLPALLIWSPAWERP